MELINVLENNHMVCKQIEKFLYKCKHKSHESKNGETERDRQIIKFKLWLESLDCDCVKTDIIQTLKGLVKLNECTNNAKPVFLNRSMGAFIKMLITRDYLSNQLNFLSYLEMTMGKKMDKCCLMYTPEKSAVAGYISHSLDILQICGKCFTLLCPNCIKGNRCINGCDISGTCSIYDYVYSEGTAKVAVNPGNLFYLQNFLLNTQNTNIFKTLSINSVDDEMLQYEVQVMFRGMESDFLMFNEGDDIINNIAWSGKGSVFLKMNNEESQCSCEELRYLVNTLGCDKQRERSMQTLTEFCVLGNYLFLVINYSIKLINTLEDIQNELSGSLSMSEAKKIEHSNNKRKRENISKFDNFNPNLSSMIKRINMIGRPRFRMREDEMRKNSNVVAKMDNHLYKKIQHINSSMNIKVISYNDLQSLGEIDKGLIKLPNDSGKFYYDPSSQYRILIPPFLLNISKNQVLLLNSVENKYNNFYFGPSLPLLENNERPLMVNNKDVTNYAFEKLIELKFDNPIESKKLTNQNIKRLFSLFETKDQEQ